MIKYSVRMERIEKSQDVMEVEVPEDAKDPDAEAVRLATEKAVDCPWDWIGEVDYQYISIARHS